MGCELPSQANRSIMSASHKEDTKGVFSTLFIFAHGYASLYANNTMVYDERNVMKALENIFFGAIYSVKGEQNEKNN